MRMLRSSLDYVSGLIIWGAAESAVTIMAASIPVLRTLFHDLRVSSRKYYGSHRIEDSVSSRFGRSQNGKGDISVAMSDLEGQQSHLGDKSLGQNMKSEIVLIRHPDAAYGSKRFTGMGRR
jgi:hypothetical protein